MYIKWMRVSNYRNLRDVQISFHEKINYIVGENSIGKSNFLDLLEILSQGKGFEEKDFFSPVDPICITLCLISYENNQPKEQTFCLEQVVQEIYPRLYILEKGKNKKQSLPLERLRSLLYLSHSGRPEDLEEVHQETYRALANKLRQLGGEEVQAAVACLERLSYVSGLEGRVEVEFQQLAKHIALILQKQSINRDICFATDHIKLTVMVALKILLEIYESYTSVAINFQQLVEKTPQEKFILPLFISIDEPEIHLSPYLQRGVLSYYREIMNNENEPFLDLLKKLFDLDGLSGQIFIVTHSTDALVDDYRHIIRFYRDKEGNVCSVSGTEFSFSKEVEKHLIMHFSDVKEALYARCVLIVEGETEYGSFRGLGKTVGVNFDYYGICLVNARGEASISRLATLFRKFSIPVVAFYDADVKSKYSQQHDNLYTEEICYEMDLVMHLLKRNKRWILDSIVNSLTENGKGLVTKDMLRKGLSKLSRYVPTLQPRALKNISNRQVDDLQLYYFSWFYSNKGVVVGRAIANQLKIDDIPLAFLNVIQRVKELSQKIVEIKN